MERRWTAACAGHASAASEWLTSGLDTVSSGHLWGTTAVGDHGKMQVLKSRFNRLMTNDILHKWGVKASDKCEICCSPGGGGMRDGVKHVLLQCQHPTVHGLVTKRHDKAVWEVAKAIARGRKGGDHTLVNAGTGEGGRAPERTVPRWMLKHGIEVEESDDGVVHDKPDIVLIEGKKAGERVRNEVRKRSVVHIIEVGYCWDYLWGRKREEKLKAYAKLCEALGDSGWKEVVMHVVPLGATGVFEEGLSETWEQLGLDRKACVRLKKRLMDVTWDSLYKIVKSRRAAIGEVESSRGELAGRAWDVG